MDKALMDSYRKSLSDHTNCRPSLALSATLEDLLGVFLEQRFPEDVDYDDAAIG